MERLWIGLGGLAGLTAVAMAAYSSHGLDALPPAQLRAVQSGVQMQGWHALALVGCGAWVAAGGGLLANLAGAAFLLGILLFCAATYSSGLAATSLGLVAPTGGLLLMAGWLLLALSALRPR